MKQAIGYVRVSTDKQARDGVSIEAQIDKINAWSTLHGYEIVKIHIDEGISGSTLEKREGMKAALAEVKKDMAFVCYSLSRVSRDVEDTIRIARTIEQKGADLVSINEKIDTTGAVGKMLFNFIALLNQFERDQIAERTKFALDHLKKHNKVYSPTPYGYDRINDDLVPNLEELQVIVTMQELREKSYGHRKIASYLNKAGIHSKMGGLWYAKTVKGVLNRNGKE
nr:recombinase family protein [uncultured Acinetobacter sp.]